MITARRSSYAFRIVVTALAAAILVCLIVWPAPKKLPSSMGADGGPDQIQLTGIVRDFHSTHPGFSASPGVGHVAGLVSVWLPGDNRPMLGTTTGFQVTQQWRDSDGRPIAPHLFNTIADLPLGETLGIRVNGKVKLDGECTIDAFDSMRGLYGQDGNYGWGAYLSTNSTDHKAIDLDKKNRIHGDVDVGPGGDPGRVVHHRALVVGNVGVLAEAYPMPDIELPDPADLGVSQGDVHHEKANLTLTGDLDPDDDSVPPAMVFRELKIKESTIQVRGDLTILCEQFKLEDSQIVLLPEATLTLYVTGDHTLDLKKSLISPDPELPATTSVIINYLGDKHLHLHESHVYATILATHPKAELEMHKAHVYGAFVGSELKLNDKSSFHVDRANAIPSSRNPAITVLDKIEIKERSEVDSFDSNVGPYDGPRGGGTNWGERALLMTNSIKKDKVKIEDRSTVRGDVLAGAGADPDEVIEVKDRSTVTGIRGNMARAVPIPVVTPPAAWPTVGDREYKNGTFTLSEDLRCKHLKLDKAILEIAGDVTIRCDDHAHIHKQSQIRLLPGARLTVYVKKDMEVHDKSKVNSGGNPQMVSIRRMTIGSKGKVKVKDRSELCAWVQGAGTELAIEDRSEFFGSFIGKKVKLKKDSKLHVDMAYLLSCVQVKDTAGVKGGASDGAIGSADDFDQWFREVLGVNQSGAHTITLTNNGSGVYEFLTDEFHPIDGKLFGNEGAAHNFAFTFAINAQFDSLDCAGQFIEFKGGDGAWLYIDGYLAMDLGGVGAPSQQFVQLDRLGLSPDQAHTFQFFYAQRSSNDLFNLRTNIQFKKNRMPGVTDQYD